MRVYKSINVLLAFIVFGVVIGQQKELNSLQERLQKAILNDDSSKEIESLVKSGAVVNFEEESKSPILKAVLLKKENAVDALLKAGAKPSLMYNNQKLVLHAIKQGDLKIAKMLIDAGADFSGTVDFGQDAFTYVATTFDLPEPGKMTRIDWDLLYAMVKKGYDLEANFNNKDLNNNSWYLAIKNGLSSMIFFFLNRGDRAKQNPYHLPFTANVNQVFTLPDGSTITPIILALKFHAEHAKKRIGGGVVGELLSYAEKKIDLEQQVQPDGKKLQSPISFSLEYNISRGSVGSTVNTLVYNGANLTKGLELFIKNGGSVDHAIDTGKTLIGIAIENNDIVALKFLISAKADVNKKSNEKTPLYHALQKNDPSIADVLLQNGAKI